MLVSFEETIFGSFDNAESKARKAFELYEDGKCSQALTELEEAIAINSQQARHMVELAEEELGGLEGKRIAVLGLSFKPNTDDIREATSLKIIKLLLEKDALVKVYDPVAMSQVEKSLGAKVSYSSGVEECLKEKPSLLQILKWHSRKAVPLT